jgi:hypothetical protein
MPKNTVCLVAGAVVRDAESNRISVFSILEQIASEGFPVLVPELGVLALWHKESADPNEIELHFRIKNNEVEVFSSPVTLNFSESDVNRTIVSIRSLLIATPGPLTFEFVRNEDVIGSYEVIVKAPAPKATVEPPASAEPKSDLP